MTENRIAENEGRVHICPQCGREFYISRFHRWGWLVGPEYRPIPVCGYKCQREWEQKTTSKPNYSRKRVPVKIAETGERFASIADCAKHLNVKRQNITACINYGRPYKGLHIERVVE